MGAVIHSDMLAGINSLPYLLRRCAKFIAQQAEQLIEGRELNLSQCITMMLIELEVATTPGEIADSLGHSAGATTRTIDRLKGRGLLKRRREMKDRRVVTLTLTPQGSRIAREIHQILAECDRHILAGFDLFEIQVLVSLLRRLMTALEAGNGS